MFRNHQGRTRVVGKQDEHRSRREQVIVLAEEIRRSDYSVQDRLSKWRARTGKTERKEDGDRVIIAQRAPPANDVDATTTELPVRLLRGQY
jgi:hypothetical protein